MGVAVCLYVCLTITKEQHKKPVLMTYLLRIKFWLIASWLDPGLDGRFNVWMAG